MRSRTPSAPAWATLARWETFPSMGVGSSLKSPVWTMVPMGVRITTPELSGMEWVIRDSIQGEVAAHLDAVVGGDAP